MRNLIVKWEQLKGEIKNQVNMMLSETDPELISFPYGGKNVQGFIYKTDDTSYLIIQNETSYANPILSDDDEDSPDVDSVDFESEEEE